MILYQLRDLDSDEELGLVAITIHSNDGFDASLDELRDGWQDYNGLEEHENDPNDIDQFIIWFNEGYFTQIERVYIEEL